MTDNITFITCSSWKLDILTTVFLKSWLKLSECFLVIKSFFFCFVAVFIKSELGSDWGAAVCYKTQQRVERVGLKGSCINILYPCVRSKVAPLNTSYHPPLLRATLLLFFQMALTDETIRELSLLTTCSAWNRELETTPTCTEVFPFFWTLKYSFDELQDTNTNLLLSAILSLHPAPDTEKSVFMIKNETDTDQQ